MSWLVNSPTCQEELAGRFRAALMADQILVLPGAYDPISGLIAKSEGFGALYLSGAAYSASRGLPDAGLVTSSEVAERAKEIVRATGLALLVDSDTGYGSPLAAARAARELADVGVAAIQIEDQTLPKACGHLDVQRLVSVEQFLATLSAIRQAAPTMVCVVRTDARTAEGLDAALARATAYVAAGADAIFPEALQSVEEFQRFRDEVDGPLIANMTEFGKSPQLTATELQELGYAGVLFPVSALRLAMAATRHVYATIRASGSTSALVDEMLTRRELYALLQYDEYESFDLIVRDMLAGQNSSGPDAALAVSPTQQPTGVNDHE